MEGADEEAAALLKAKRDAEIALARLVTDVEKKGHFRLGGCASVAEWLVFHGAGDLEAMTLRGLGQTLAGLPEAEDRIRRGIVEVEKAAVIGPVVARHDLAREGDNWLESAAEDPIGRLRRKVKKRLEQTAQRSRTLVGLTVYVKP